MIKVLVVVLSLIAKYLPVSLVVLEPVIFLIFEPSIGKSARKKPARKLVNWEVLNYLYTKRQIDRELITRFSLGCSISGQQIGITDNNRIYDFFSEKQLIIPLANKEGEIVAFAGRKIDGGASGAAQTKYKYLPSSQYYRKSSLLYNYSVVKKSRATECYLVEGFFDVISLTKIGVENCLALLGTNLSEEQTKLLQELKKRIILFLDSDKAGQEATINISLRLLSHEIDCEVVKGDYQGDPDEICQQNEPKT
ncbi:10250_t:CDS:2, partial [Ambispora gerdemannii]